ncbi:SusD family protein [bacterium A37T11]|nr:SusD family protein [bacterium A37T11]
MKKYSIFIIFISTFYLSSCKKYLDKVPDSRLTIPTEINDLQYLLNFVSFMNVGAPELPDYSTDNVLYSFTSWQGFVVNQLRNSYICSKDIFQGETSIDWNYGYRTIYYSNVVLDGLSNLKNLPKDQQYNTTKAHALFFRALTFFNLQDQFGQPYDQNTSDHDLSIVLRLTPDLTAKVQRSTVKETYDQIIKDLNTALILLPNDFNLKIPTLPGKPAVYALLARVYLTMQNYEQAGSNADSSLKLYSTLCDYNTINASQTYPLSRKQNVEVLFENNQRSSGNINLSIDTALYNSYDKNDLRKIMFFRTGTNGSVLYQGSYGNLSGNPSNGLTTDEMYLIRAETRARSGDQSSAMDDLNALLVKRWAIDKVTGLTLYKNRTSSSAEDALKQILVERRKELIYRGLRWSDLRRLNKDPRFAKTLTRSLNGQIYTLPPNNSRYAFPIPIQEIQLTGIPQNNR